jgi:BirA family biotin operon repressor/biotin-[acetyl-CoA-carboxylase] ligase
MKSKTDIIWLDNAESSNDEARKAIEGLDNLSVIAVRNQTKGRGQGDHQWCTAPGMNLTFSIALKDLDIIPSEQIAISQITALSVVDFLYLYGIDANIKLPNDIYVGTKKICGILIENSICSSKMTWSIVGVGINVNQTSFPSSLPNPTSILLETASHALSFKRALPELDLELLLTQFHSIFSGYYYNYLARRDTRKLAELELIFKSKVITAINALFCKSGT